MKNLETMTPDERSLLLYFESRTVDHGALIATIHMNKEDFDIAKKWNEEGFIKFGRIAFHSIRDSCTESTHWCELSEEAWILAHTERRAKYKRVISKQAIDKIRGE